MTDRPMLFSAPMVQALLDGRKTQTRRPLYRAHKIDDTREGPQVRYFPNYPPPNLGLNHMATLGTAHLLRPGDRIWVKETWRAGAGYDGARPSDIPPFARIWFEADGCNDNADAISKKARPSIFMPRWASRITLTVTDVRIERLNDCSEADAIAEGVCRELPTDADRAWLSSYHEEHYGAPPTQADIDQFNEGVWVVPGTECGFGPKPRQPLWGPTASNCYASLWESINGAGNWAANPWVVAISFDVARRNIDQ